MSFDPARVRAVIFDLDGTLKDSDDAAVNRLARLLPGHDTKTARRIVMGVESPLTSIFALLDNTGLDTPLMKVLNWYYQSRMNHKPIHYSAVPNTINAVNALSRRYKLGVVSTRWESTALQFLDQHNIRARFGCIATALTCARTKPYPDPVLWACQQMALAPGECVMVGDTTVDMRAGRSAGTQCVGVLCGFGEHDELLRAGADVILQTTADLPDLLL